MAQPGHFLGVAGLMMCPLLFSLRFALVLFRCLGILLSGLFGFLSLIGGFAEYFFKALIIRRRFSGSHQAQNGVRRRDIGSSGCGRLCG